MPIGSDDQAWARALALTELEVIYEASALRELIARALLQLEQDEAEFETRIAAGACCEAAHTLHRIKGTAAFFCGDEPMLDTLHRAECALRLNPPCAELVVATLPQARRMLAALIRALQRKRTELPEP
ncbi:hypothetical protein LJR230_002567 [Trinickia sp. LjRoot230]|uniref:hypothetical protein n=1 Tax=Trinickia sp. LjRoot230 TaxID=3342288 RepID=UPI003ED11537